MKFSVDAKEFLGACLKVEKATASKTTLPILEGILIKSVDEEKVSLYCYDLEFSISTTVKAVVEEKGAICISSSILIDMLKQMNGCVTFTEKEKQQVNLSNINGSYTIMSYNPEEYPEIACFDAEESFDIKQSVLGSMIKQTLFAVSNDVTKGVHTGVKFEVTPHKLTLVALDGYRFAIRESEITYYDKDVSFVVPAKTLKELASIVSNKEEEMSVEKCKLHVVFTTPDIKIVSNVQMGDFLDYKKAIPAGSNFSIMSNPKELITGVDRCAVVIDDKKKSPLKIEFKDEDLIMSAETTAGRAKTSIKIKGETPDDFVLGVNHKFLKEALEACKEDEEVTVSFLTPTSPIIIKNKNKDKTHLILVVRL